MSGSWSDRELLEGIASQNEEAIRVFDERFRLRLLSFARRRRLNREDAEDTVQETLIAAVRQIQAGAFAGSVPLSAFVNGIFVRRCADTRRRNARRGRLLADSRDIADIEQMPANPEWRSASPEVIARVREVLLALAPRERLVLLLNQQQGLKAREIAPVLQLGVKATEATLTRARKRFRDMILGDEETDLSKRLQ
jgi:RNA polymerase sigma factor (sigma-70 family)